MAAALRRTVRRLDEMILAIYVIGAVLGVAIVALMLRGDAARFAASGEGRAAAGSARGDHAAVGGTARTTPTGPGGGRVTSPAAPQVTG